MQLGIEAGAHDTGGALGAQPGGQMRGQARHGWVGLNGKRHGCGIAGAAQHGGGGLFRRDGKAIRPALCWALRECDQKGCFRAAEMVWCMTEIMQACGAHAFNIAAIGGEREIQRHDLRFAEMRFQLHGAHHVLQLAADAVAMRGEQARHLHGERGAAGDNAAMGQHLPRGAQQGQRINTWVLVKTLVFGAQQQVDEGGINLRLCGWQTPKAVAGNAPVQRGTVAGL